MGFDGFDFEKMVGYGEDDVERLLVDVGIIWYCGKIEVVINNVKCVKEMVVVEGFLVKFFWSYELDLEMLGMLYMLIILFEFVVIFKEFKKCGWKFVGFIMIFVFM